jgi:hypothetical protein
MAFRVSKLKPFLSCRQESSSSYKLITLFEVLSVLTLLRIWNISRRLFHYSKWLLWGFFPYSVYHYFEATCITGSKPLLCSAFRFSQPLDGLLLKLPCGFVSCHWHSWDSPCRVFPLKTAPRSRRAQIPCINVSFSSNNRRHVCWGIARQYPPEGTCGPTNTLDIWSYSVPKSVHILPWYYPQQEADTLLGFVYAP